MAWILLVYSVPSQPSRKRAAVWRELKKAGAVYLRDGVAVLPEGPETLAAFRAIAAKVAELGGWATLIEGARLGGEQAEGVIAQARAGRAEEYAEIERDAERLLAHVEREQAHREFTFAELEEIEADLGKLRRWAAQVRGRDHFGAGEGVAVDDLFERCERAVAGFLKEAYHRTEEAAP